MGISSFYKRRDRAPYRAIMLSLGLVGTAQANVEDSALIRDYVSVDQLCLAPITAGGGEVSRAGASGSGIFFSDGLRLTQGQQVPAGPTESVSSPNLSQGGWLQPGEQSATDPFRDSNWVSSPARTVPEVFSDRSNPATVPSTGDDGPAAPAFGPLPPDPIDRTGADKPRQPTELALAPDFQPDDDAGRPQTTGPSDRPANVPVTGPAGPGDQGKPSRDVPDPAVADKQGPPPSPVQAPPGLPLADNKPPIPQWPAPKANRPPAAPQPPGATPEPEEDPEIVGGWLPPDTPIEKISDEAPGPVEETTRTLPEEGINTRPVDTFVAIPVAIPEPQSLALLGIGLLALGLRRRGRNHG